jgi:dTDP-glucose 4,6-dehydratase
VKTVFVTGGAGFIGSAFVRHLHEAEPETRLIVLDALRYSGDISNLPPEMLESGRLEFWPGSVNDVSLVAELVSRSDVVVHFAAETHVARSLYGNREFFETDVLGTQSVANAVLLAMDTVERFVHISTSEVYGTAAYEPMDEQHPLNPCTPYASAKAGADRLVYSYVQSYDLPAVIVRPFNNYGPGQHLEKLVPRLVTSMLLGEPLSVHGTGDARRDWIHVGDTVRGVKAVLDAPLDRVRGQAVNLGTGRATSVLEVANMVAAADSTGRAEIAFMEDRLGQVETHIAGTSHALEIAGFEAKLTLEEGLEQTIDWYRENQDWWQRLLNLRRVPVKMRDGSVVWY